MKALYKVFADGHAQTQFGKTSWTRKEAEELAGYLRNRGHSTEIVPDDDQLRVLDQVCKLLDEAKVLLRDADCFDKLGVIDNNYLSNAHAGIGAASSCLEILRRNVRKYSSVKGAS